MFRILYEDDRLLAVDKPPGLLVHPTKPGGPKTLWDGLRELLAFELQNGGQISFINRLDRETSGLVLAAKTPEAARELAMAMAEGRIRKGYLAIVLGWPERDGWETDVPILRLGEVEESPIWLKRGVREGGSPARTRFRVVRRLTHPAAGDLALLEAQPLTGRTHQIRVHLAHEGFPVVGDKIYGRRPSAYLEFIESGWTASLQRELFLPRHALHSSWMQIGEKTASFSAALPRDFAEVLSEI